VKLKKCIQLVRRQRIVNRYKLYLQPLHMFRQINCHPQGVFIKELEVPTASKYTIGGFTVQVFTVQVFTVQVFTTLTILKCIDV
jgi:hypothetical protein